MRVWKQNQAGPIPWRDRNDKESCLKFELPSTWKACFCFGQHCKGSFFLRNSLKKKLLDPSRTEYNNQYLLAKFAFNWRTFSGCCGLRTACIFEAFGLIPSADGQTKRIVLFQIFLGLNLCDTWTYVWQLCFAFPFAKSTEMPFLLTIVADSMYFQKDCNV